MKKHSLISFLGMTACLFISCNNYLGRGNHIDIGGGFPEGGCICFFQFTDTSYMNNILIAPENGNGYEYMLHYGKILDGGEWWLPLFPKNLEGQPIFGESTHGGTNIDFYYLDGTFYTVEDVVENPKYIALKGDYYICYPFTALESRGRYINAEWKDFYTIDFRNVKIIPSNHVFKIRYNISELVLANLTQKSTKHFPRKNAEMITIDDVVETLNRLIETNKIDDYCYQLYHY